MVGRFYRLLRVPQLQRARLRRSLPFRAVSQRKVLTYLWADSDHMRGPWEWERSWCASRKAENSIGQKIYSWNSSRELTFSKSPTQWLVCAGPTQALTGSKRQGCPLSRLVYLGVIHPCSKLGVGGRHTPKTVTSTVCWGLHRQGDSLPPASGVRGLRWTQRYGS